MKARVTIGNEHGYPPLGSVGTAEKKDFLGITYRFVPDDVNHYPPDCPPEEFEHYDLTFFEIKRITK